jgi:hypothetical protein
VAEDRHSQEPGEVVAEACIEPWTAAWAEADERVLHPLTAQVKASLERHRGISAEIGLSNSLPEGFDAAAAALETYRRQVGSDVLSPLQQVLELQGPVSTLGHIFATALENASSACAALPVGARIPWEDGALVGKPSDTSFRSMGKFFARIVSAARHPGRDRVVPLRTLALRHLRTSVLPTQDAAAASAVASWACWTGRLEVAWAEWGETSLPVLMRGEVPSDEEERVEAWSSLQAAAERLDSQLEALAAEAPSRDAAHEAVVALDRARGVLEADLAVLGSFLLRLSDNAPSTKGLRRTRRAGDVLTPWDEQVAARLRLQTALLGVLSGGSAVQHRLVYRIRASCVESLAPLGEMANSLAGMVREWEVPPARSQGLGDALADSRFRAEAIVSGAIATVPDLSAVAESVREASDATVEALQAMVRQAPSTLVLHGLGGRLPTATRSVETRTLPLQELARQAFDALRMERIRSSAFGVVPAMESLIEDVAELPDVVGFAFDAAAKELEEPGPEAIEQAVGLVTEALTRTAGVLRTVPTIAEEAIAETRRRVAQEVGEGCEGLIDRVGAGRMQAQFLAARSHFSEFRVRLNEVLGPPLDRGIRRVTRSWARARGALSSGLRRGTVMVGGEAEEAQARSARMLRALAGVDTLADTMPLVYQRLYRTEPVADPALLAGRGPELSDAMSRWGRWSDGDGVPLVVRGHAASGVSSFLNVLRARLEEEGAKIGEVVLTERIDDEETLAAELASALGVESASTLDQIAAKVLQSREGTAANVMVVDNLEHLYLRVPGGTDLIERLLTLMSETGPRVFWVGGVRSSSWQLIARAERTAASQVDGFELTQLSVGELREAVIRRHRRSGLQVRYEEPVEGRALLKRRVRRLRGTEAHQELLAADFFERLHRVSLGNLRLALFLWLLAADFEVADGEVYVHSLDLPDFSLLERLDLAQNFTLKAFLEHRTLTLAEHDDVFRMPRQQSYQLFESLGNRHLIEAVDKREGGRAESEIVEGLRYRIRPLLTGAVVRHLEKRNIVH